MFVPRTKTSFLAGHKVKLYSIGWLAYMCDRTRDTIRRWERTNILPAPIFHVSENARWYTAAELMGYSQIIRTANIKRGEKTLLPVMRRTHEFRSKLKKVFREEPHRLKEDLPNEFGIEDVMNRHRQKFFLKEAKQILQGI